MISHMMIYSLKGGYYNTSLTKICTDLRISIDRKLYKTSHHHNNPTRYTTEIRHKFKADQDYVITPIFIIPLFIIFMHT